MKKYSKLMVILLVFAMILPGVAQAAPVVEAEEVNSNVIRLSGADRIKTSVKVSQTAYKDGAESVVIVGYEGEVDALAGTLLAHAKKGPVLFTKKGKLSEDTKTEIARLGAKNVYILGGTAAIEDAVKTELETLKYTVKRISGSNREGTAAAVTKEVGGKTTHVFLARGYGDLRAVLADALAVGPASAKGNMAVLLTRTDKVPVATLKSMKDLGVTNVTIVGGEGAVNSGVKTELETLKYTVDRLSGTTREGTAIAIANKYFAGKANALVANGYGSPDALVGGYLGAAIDAPILFSQANKVSEVTTDYLKANTEKAWILGGEGVVNKEVLNKVLGAVDVKVKERAVSAISVDKTTLTLTAGGATGTITATVLPAGATNKTVTWTSSDEAVATVAGGVVTPLTVGTTTITATTVDGGFTATTTVTVEAPSAVDKAALTEAITAANTNKGTVEVSADGSEVDSGTDWVTQAVMDAYTNAIAAAQAVVDNADATQAEVDAAVTALAATTTTFNEAKANGTWVLDKSALNDAITAANAAMAGVAISADGTDIAPGTYWVTQAVNDALAGAITTATEALATVETDQQVTDAAAALDTAVETYNAAKEDGTWVTPAIDTESELQAAVANGGTVTLGGNITLSSALIVDNTVTLDLNGYTIDTSQGVYVSGMCTGVITVNGGSLTIEGPGAVDGSKYDDYAVEVRGGGTVTINGGTFKGSATAVQANVGNVYINGGSFEATPVDTATYGENGYQFTLNCIDANYTAGTARIKVTGGTFYKFNPGDNLSEGPLTNYLAPGYQATADGDNYVVSETPAADQAVAKDKAELEAALADEGVTEITVEGNIGSVDAYTIYNVGRDNVTIQGAADAKVYGSFIVKADGVTIKNLAIQNKGDLTGESTTNRGGIYVFAEKITLTNNTITNGLGENAGLSNAIQIMSPKADNPLSNYVIKDNELIGHNNEVTNWSSSGIVIAQGYKPGSIGQDVLSITATESDYTNLLNNNTFTNNKIDLTHQDWTTGLEGGPVLYPYPVDETKAVATDKAELEAALLNTEVTEITIDGTLGSDSAYTIYNVTRAVTIQGAADAKVFGTFIVKTDDVTIDGLAIQNKGDLTGESSNNRGGIYVFAEKVTLTNNTITNGLGDEAGLSNAIQIMSSKADNPLSNYVITGNKLIGHDNEVTNWSSSGIVIAQGYKPGSIGEKVLAITASLEDYQALLSGNTFENNKIDLTHQDWSKSGDDVVLYPVSVDEE